MAQLSDYSKNDLFFHVTGVNIQEYHLNENIVTNKKEIHKLIDNVVSIYEEKLRWIPVEEELPIQEQSDYQIAVIIRGSNYCPNDVLTIPYNGVDFDFGRFSRFYSKWRRF